MKEKFTGPASGKPESDSGVFPVNKLYVEPLDWGDFGDINGEKKANKQSPKVSNVEPFNWGDFGNINGEKKLRNNPFAEYQAETSSAECKPTAREEETIWREVHWKYPRTRGDRVWKRQPTGPNGEVRDPKEEGFIYTEEEKQKILPLFEKQKQLYFDRKKFRSK